MIATTKEKVMRVLVALAVMAVLPSVGFSNAIWVPDDYQTIQEAIDNAVDGDEVIVRPGVYVEPINFIGKGITVKSELGPEVTTIDGNHNPGKLVTFATGEGPDSVLEGFTVTRAYDHYSLGAIHCKGSSPTIRGNVITQNGAYFGGGIVCDTGSAPRITGNWIHGNGAERGGGIACSESSPRISRNRIEDNGATGKWGGGGGGIYCSNSSPMILDNLIIGNHTGAVFGGGSGGGICCVSSVATILRNRIEDNYASSYDGSSGGGISSRYSTVTIANNRITGNSAGGADIGGAGGGIVCSQSDVALTDNLIASNRAEGGTFYPNYGGGVVCWDSCTLLATGNTITENAAQQGGGVLIMENTTANLSSNIMWGNMGNTGAQISIGGLSTSLPATLTINYSDVEGSQPLVYVGPGSTLNWGVGMIDADPLFIDPTNGDCRLQQNPCQSLTSPCVDAGDPNSPLITGTTRTDLVQDAGTVDMGFHYDIASIPGVPYCYGDPGSGTPCPCPNDNDGGVPGSGCANGSFIEGARLTGSGTASVSADTLVLTSVRMEPNNSGLYFQADNDLSPGNTWGDGLRCAGGNLKRLEVLFADGDGTSSTTVGIADQAGDVQAGDTKYYQCWYRNPTGSPCGNDFNSSNGYAITWLP